MLDEVQRAPELVSYLQGIVDRDSRMGLFLYREGCAATPGGKGSNAIPAGAHLRDFRGVRDQETPPPEGLSRFPLFLAG